MAAHCYFLAGVTAGACNMFISHPLDTIKTNMQNENMRFFQAAKVLFKTEGVSEQKLISHDDSLTLFRLKLSQFWGLIKVQWISQRSNGSTMLSFHYLYFLIILGKVILSWIALSTLLDWIFEFNHFRCLRQLISNISELVHANCLS